MRERLLVPVSRRYRRTKQPLVKSHRTSPNKVSQFPTKTIKVLAEWKMPTPLRCTSVDVRVEIRVLSLYCADYTQLQC
ncbi:hypothetical protein WN51_04049 [Melipona quadrifasciata]|uniref:Uncharacterized protein n=1 Tax=Melipona quadrifasciata TaxID=166423 RepID=A0A0M8ZS81_9HYME|nr:hypothetical protein WN51_04049 [Melipona quadrifasciata]